MKYPFLVFVVLAAVLIATAVGWWLRRQGPRRATRSGWVANSGHMRSLPRYRILQRRTRIAVIGTGACLLAATGAMAGVAGSPVDRHLDDRILASRDIVLCLDASGSMLPYDSSILASFNQLVDNFHGERVALQIWSAQTMTLFPLTDDYDMAKQTLTDTADTIQRGFMGESADGVYVTQQLLDFLSGTDDPSGAHVSSLAGDGLATCALGFDHTDRDRSRTIILATDNEIMGDQIYDIKEAAEFAHRNGIRLIALYPGKTIEPEGKEMQQAIESVEGSFYMASDPATAAKIIEEIEAEQRADELEDPKVIEDDVPNGALAWAVMGVLALVGVVTWARL